MNLSPYLSFNGQCAEALKFYERALGGRIVTMQTHGDSPMADEVPPEWRERVLHARLEVGQQMALMASDMPPDRYAAPQGITLSIGIATPEEAARVFNALSTGGTVTMPFGKTFWSVGFGTLVDRFGIPWMVNCEQAA
jgi:PhnB protein